MRKRHRMINKVKKKYWRTMHKFGIRLPKSPEEAIQIDRENGNTLWQDAMKKEMAKAKVAYKGIGHTPEEVRAGKVPDLIGHQFIKCHFQRAPKASTEKT